MVQSDKNREFKLAKREFRRLSKRELIEVVFELQTLILNLKAKNVELERMLEERGDVILGLNRVLDEQSCMLDQQSREIEELRYRNIEMPWDKGVVEDSGVATPASEKKKSRREELRQKIKNVCIKLVGSLIGYEG